jgi:diketogulonate reductase-like aldo/keto reductase
MTHDTHRRHPSRRVFLGTLAGAGIAMSYGGRLLADAAAGGLTRPIPATGDTVPAIGMGTWITFNVGEDSALRDDRAGVLQAFFDLGGGVIDSSPMYGSSEAVIGYGLAHVSGTERLFSATKVWTPFTAFGEGQMAESRRLWGVTRFDLMQIHNMVNWRGHLPGLLEDRAAGRVRYIGVTTSHGRRHDELESIMTTEPLDAVQVTYNILDREAEARLLPLAADRGMAVIVNRPFRRGALFDHVGGHPLPGWSAEIDCSNWAQVLLKFIVSHPAVTCAIPATSRVDHMTENMGALTGRLPDPDLRQRMVRDIEAL